MSKRRRGDYVGCSLETRGSVLRLRFRWGSRQHAVRTGLADTAEHHTRLEPLVRLVGAAIAAGKDPRPILHESLRSAEPGKGQSVVATTPTVRTYFDRWVADKVPGEVRRAQAIDYRRHIRGYVLPALGDLPLIELAARDILGLRAELRQRGLSMKYVKNILAGSLKAMLRDARVIDRAITHDPFEGITWPRVENPRP